MSPDVHPGSQIEIVRATRADLPRIIALFDEAVQWLVERGITGQWGTVPFSEHPDVEQRFLGWIDPGAMVVARLGGEVVGCLAMVPHPPDYAADACAGLPGPAHYLEAFVTDRRLAGVGIGRKLLGWAEGDARRRGLRWLRLDCWAGNRELVSYYQRAGYLPVRQFGTGSWIGQLLVKDLG